MKKKFIRVMFFGALALTTFSYVGCKDYDDDIDRLEQKITENANAIAEINKLIEGGSVITKVENITGGVEVTLSNGKSFTIKNGDAGKDGTQWTIKDDGYWYQDGKKTEFKAKGDKEMCIRDRSYYLIDNIARIHELSDGVSMCFVEQDFGSLFVEYNYFPSFFNVDFVNETSLEKLYYFHFRMVGIYSGKIQVDIFRSEAKVHTSLTVSYTHLDVYKRQTINGLKNQPATGL